MKKIFTLTLLSLTILCVAGCNKETNTTQAQKSVTPAGTITVEKITPHASKCAEGKCGKGKCNATPKMAP